MSWPFNSTCVPSLLPGEQCTEDIQCDQQSYCWYQNAAAVRSNITTCMPMYQQNVGTVFGWFSKNNNLNPTEDDYIANGKFCSTGMAFNSNLNEATCTSGTYVTFNGRNLTQPYPCDPSDPTKKCRIYFNTQNSSSSWFSLGTRGYVQNDCKCSMENTSLPGTSPGYCGSVLGLEPYTRFIAQKAFVLSTINGT